MRWLYYLAGSLEVMEVLGTCDEVLKLVAAAICKPSEDPAKLAMSQSEALDLASESSSAMKPAQTEAPSVLPGTHVLTIATAK